MAATLEQFVHLNRRSAQLRREMWLSVAYPLAVMVSLGVLVACFEFLVVAELGRLYEDIYADVGMQTFVGLPAMTRFMIAWSGTPSLVLLAVVLILGVLLPLVWSSFRPLWLDVVAHRLPLVGPMWLWAGTADLCRLLALLLENGMALPKALRSSSAGLRSSELGQACRRLAHCVETGQSLSEAVAVTPPLPDTLAPVAQWGEARSTLPAALVAAAEMYEGRVRTQLAFVRLFLPPGVFLLAGGVILVTMLGIFLPMIQIIQTLT
jgi:type II secretory pathway component PulF